MGAIVKVTTSSLGGNVVAHVDNPKTLSNNETIDEAISLGYVKGDRTQIGYNAKGVLKAMIKGISKDGNGRKIDEMFSVQPYTQGRLDDVTDDITKEKVTVVARARALKELKLDDSDWTVTVEGTTGNLRISSITTGESSGVITVGEAIAINGFGLALSEGDSVKWSVTGTDKSGTVASEHLSGDMTRLNIAAAALAELASAEYNGKTIVWTLKIGGNLGVKSAVLEVE